MISSPAPNDDDGALLPGGALSGGEAATCGAGARVGSGSAASAAGFRLGFAFESSAEGVTLPLPAAKDFTFANTCLKSAKSAHTLCPP